MKYKKTFLIFGIIFYLEFIYHLFVFKNFNVKNFIYISLFTLFTSFFIDLISGFFNHKKNKLTFILLISFLTLIFIMQFINHLFYGNVISIYSMLNGGQVFEFFSQILLVIIHNILPIVLLIIPIALLIFKNKRIIILDFNFKENLIKTFLLVLIYLICVLSFNLDTNNIYSVNNLYYHKHVPNQTAKKLGIMTTMRLDIERILTNFEETADVISLSPEIKEEIQYNKIEIDFNNLISNETNSTVNNIHTYFNNSLPSEKNEYTAKFAGMNLIVITAEAFSPIAVNEILTPTLYKLVNNGFKFNNFYTPVYYVSTSDGEYANLTSLLPKESVWSMSKSSSNYLPYTYGNVFSSLGYSTQAYHNGAYKYYNRHKSHPNMGYSYMACGNGLEKKIDETFDMYSDNEKFMTYYMTISGHLEYNFSGNNMAYKNRDLVKDAPYSKGIKAYIATQIELDKALESLINKLAEKNILDNTVIALSADHYPYGLTINEMKEVMNIDDSKMDAHKNHLIIWNNQMSEPIEINKYAQSLDILPTMLNLFGISFDSRLLMGRDILSNSEGLVIFNDRSWITEYGKYNATTNIFTPFKEIIPDGYIENINNIVYNKYVISKNILETNYYKYVLGSE